MNPDQWNGLITAISGLLGAVLWPALLVFLAIRFGPSIMQKLADSERVTLKAAGMEASFEQKIRVATALGAAEAKNSSAAPADLADSVSIASTVSNAVPDADARERLQESFVLWVDDSPLNNRYEVQALEALGIRVELSESTEDALERAQQRHFDLVISDMGRPGDARAGYTLLEMLRNSNDLTPFLIYSGSRRPEHVQEARKRGAIGCTNSPQELVLMATKAIRGKILG